MPYTYFVSPSGSDQNAGTVDAPLRTLSAARDRVRQRIQSFDAGRAEDITVRLEAGIHRLEQTLVLGPMDGGDNRFSVVWEGSPDGETVLSSGVPLDGWTRCEEHMPDLPDGLDGKVWFVDLPPGTVVNTLYGSDGSLPRARGSAIQPVRIPADTETKRPPTFGPDGPILNERGITTAEGMWQHERFRFRPGAIRPASDLHEAEILVIPAMQWTMNMLSVQSVDFDTSIAVLAEPCTYPIGIPACAPEGSIWLENSLSVLSPGHWVYHAQNARLYYCPESGSPEPGLEAGSLVEFMRLEGDVAPGHVENPVTGIQIRSLTFTHSNRYRFHGLTGKGIQHDWEMHDAATCMLRMRHAEGCTVRQCRFVEGGSGGLRIDLASRENRVEHCEFSMLGGCGVVLCGYGLGRTYRNRNNAVVGNHLHHLGLAYWHCPGIFIWQSGENTISDNHLHNLPYTGIVCSGRTVYDRNGIGECSKTIDWAAVEEQCGAGYVHNIWHYSGLPSWWMREPLMHSRDNLIEYNRIHDVMEVMGDGDGIYVSGAGGGNVVRFNAIGPCPSPTMSEGIRCDDDQHHTIVHGNLIFELGGRATGIALKGVNRVTNNIVARSTTVPLRGYLSLETGPLNGSVIQKNIFLSSVPDQRFVHELRLHGTGRKARLRDTESNRNLYWCTSDSEAGRRFLDDARSYGTDVDSIAADPGFVDPENGDFRLKPDAAARHLGFQQLPLERMFDTSYRRNATSGPN